MKIVAEIKETSYEKLSNEQKKILDEAEKQMNQNPYNPYSKFSVGAAVLANGGKIFGGANVENATYTLTIHAEQSAVTNALANGENKIRALAVIAKGSGFGVKKPSMMCGICRQTVYEIAQISGVDIEIIASNTDKTTIYIGKISEILPIPFGPEILAD